MGNAGIVGLGSYLPSRVLTNHELERLVETTDEWIYTRTGIKERRIAEDGEAASDLGHHAAVNAIEDAGIRKEEIDLLICGTMTPDMLFPSTACLLQKSLELNCAAFDVSAACSGFLYALEIARNAIMSGRYRNVLVVATEVLSRLIDWEDRSTCVLFGDGAGAVVVARVNEEEGIIGNYLCADGLQWDLLFLPAGGSRIPASIQSVQQRMHYLKMKGNELFKIAVKVMSEAAQRVLREASLRVEDVSLLVPHQANVRIINAVAERINLSPQKIYMNLSQYGNCSAASIPIALDEAKKKGVLRKGDIVLLLAFGAGLTWGATLLRWS
jgi:3-oxoacyl-[acyl-carrier-protein] synthase-3